MIVEMKTFRMECDYCYKTVDFLAIYQNDRYSWPEGWIDIIFHGDNREYHYCGECRELVQHAGS